MSAQIFPLQTVIVISYVARMMVSTHWAVELEEKMAFHHPCMVQ